MRDDCDDKNTAIKISSLSSQNCLGLRSSLAERRCTYDTKCQKCFCVTLDKSNRTEDEQVYEIGGVTYAKNDKRNGR